MKYNNFMTCTGWGKRALTVMSMQNSLFLYYYLLLLFSKLLVLRHVYFANITGNLLKNISFISFSKTIQQKCSCGISNATAFR